MITKQFAHHTQHRQMASKRSISDSKSQNAASGQFSAQEDKRLNYVSFSIHKTIQIATPIMRYWQQTPLAGRIIATAVAVPILFLPVISFIFCLPVILFTIVVGYTGFLGREALLADVKEAFNQFISNEQAEKLYSNISTARTKQVSRHRYSDFTLILVSHSYQAKGSSFGHACLLQVCDHSVPSLCFSNIGKTCNFTVNFYVFRTFKEKMIQNNNKKMKPLPKGKRKRSLQCLTCR